MLTKKEIENNRKILSDKDKSMASTFKVLSDVNRYRIFRILIDEPKISISRIAKILEISMPLASQHIKVLTDAHLIEKERDGKKVLTKLEYGNPFVLAVIHTIKLALKQK